jgi:hypothetical protein
MLPPREIVFSLPPTQTRARFEPAPMIAGERHVGFGLRLRGWLTRWWRTPEPLRPEETVSGAALADAGVAAEPMALVAQSVGQPVVETVAEQPGVVPVARGRSAVRLDPARDDSEWRWPASAGSA